MKNLADTQITKDETQGNNVLRVYFSCGKTQNQVSDYN